MHAKNFAFINFPRVIWFSYRVQHNSVDGHEKFSIHRIDGAQSF
jgi:hypothetical protein